jgi:hypothetical protein
MSQQQTYSGSCDRLDDVEFGALEAQSFDGKSY